MIGYIFTWKPEKKDANDFSQGQLQDERQKLFNIQHNGELTEQEKWRAIVVENKELSENLQKLSGLLENSKSFPEK